MQHQYLVFVDKRFRSKGKAEIMSISNQFTFRESQAIASDRFLLLETDADEQRVLGAVREKPPMFVDNIIPIFKITEHERDEYNVIVDSLKEHLDKSYSFKIEVLNLNSNSSQNAKTIEVIIGSTLESEGFNMNLVDPDYFVYVLLVGNNVILGKAEKSPSGNIVDYFRLYNSEQKDAISRAEFKLKEALDFFSIDLVKVRKALDIGASPGGWTKLLAEHGINVVSVDSAYLDYELLCKNNRIEILAKKEDIKELEEHCKEFSKFIKISDISNFIPSSNCNIIQIKSRFGDTEMNLVNKLGKFDMLLIDANINPKDTAGIALSLAGTMNKNAPLLLTIKLVDNNIDKHIQEVKNMLSNDFNSVVVKKLPHNRMELTCFAKKK